MSYSRWSNSTWYTYWHCNNTWNMDEQLFDVCSVELFSYKDLKDDLDGCLATVKKKVPKATKEEMEELRRYMEVFMFDVESDVDIRFYGYLKALDMGRMPEVLRWVKTLRLPKSKNDTYQMDEIKEVREALKILKARRSRLPLLVGTVKSPLGKRFLTGRLKGAISQLRAKPLPS